MDLWRRLSEYWQRSGLAIQPGVDPAAIRAFEAKYEVHLPADLRSYFLVVNGTGPDMDPDLYRFWPLEEVKPVEEELNEVYPDRYSYLGCFVFADHCISCWDYAARLECHGETAGPVFRATGTNPPREQMAASFVEFIEMYLASPNNII